MKNTRISALFLLAGAMAIQSCSDDPKPVADYEVPTSYNFSNVDYRDAAIRLVMIAQIETLLNTGNKAGGGTNIDGTRLKNMFSNTGSPFSIDSLNSSGLQLKDQTLTEAQSVIEGYLASQASISASNAQASKGVAGVGTTKANTYILLTQDGQNNRQLFSKTIMSALLAHQIITLVGSDLDNTTVVAGKGTAMEHAWDLAFGYFNVPKDFPATTTGAKYLGSYCNQVNGGIGSNEIFMNAFLKGRAAISVKDNATKKAQADIIIKQLEILTAAAAIHEIAEAEESLDDDIQRVSRFSECLGFVQSLKYYTNRTITDTQINVLVNTYLHGGQLYDVTLDDMNNLVSTIGSIYGFADTEKI